MLKAAGAVCVLLGAAVLGRLAVGRLKERAGTLGQLIDALGYLEEELSFRLSPLPELLECLARQHTGPAGRFFAGCLEAMRASPQEGLRTSWQWAAETYLGILRAEERDVLLPLGNTLGRYDSEGQRQAIRQALARLEQLRTQAEEERGRLGKLYSTVSLAAGALVVIVFM